MPDMAQPSPSIYASYLQGYGRRWHRPWLVLFLALLSVGLLGVRVPRTRLQEDDPGQYRTGSIDGPSPLAHLYRDVAEGEGLLWTADLSAGLARAHRENRLVLVAFEGLSDTNGKLNWVNVFPQPQVQRALAPYVRVVLYVDLVPEHFCSQKPPEHQREAEAQHHRAFQLKILDTIETPLYVVLRPLGGGRFRILDQYEGGRIQGPDQFAQFLHKSRPRLPLTVWLR